MGKGIETVPAGASPVCAVLDGFLGSASTLIACEQLERTCYGVELEVKFVDVAVSRYVAFHDGNASDVYVIRNGQKLTLDEAMQLMDEEGGADDGTDTDD